MDETIIITWVVNSYFKDSMELTIQLLMNGLIPIIKAMMDLIFLVFKELTSKPTCPCGFIECHYKKVYYISLRGMGYT